MATTRRLPSDSGAFADWVASSSTGVRPTDQDLSLGFNSPAPGPNASGGGGGMWPPSTAARQINYALPPDMNMVGHLRDVFVVAPASSFHHHHHHDTHSDPNAQLGVGVGVIPLLNMGGGVDQDDYYSNNSNSRGRNSNANTTGNMHQFWQQAAAPQSQNYMKKPMLIDQNTPQNLLQGGIGGGGSGGGGSSSTATCQDCGNQAKKDCSHRRCRTCCKSRGFDCATHVKSTWVPAARRRERQLMAAASGGPTAGSSGSTSGSKKPRLIASQTTTNSHTSASNTPPRSFDTSSSHQDASFKEGLPSQVRAPAVFKCVRVTAVDEGDDEYAYQAVVKIGGHVFKGFLYDQGVEGREEFPNISELHLGGGGGGGRNGASSSSPIIDADVYAASGGGMLGASAYGNQIN